MTTSVTRYDLQQLKGINPKLIQFFEQLFVTGQSNASALEGAEEGTRAIQDATVLTLSSNAAFNNERILSLDPAQFVMIDSGPGGALLIQLACFIATNGGFQCTFNLEADTNLDLPSTGRVPSSSDGPFADDAAAAAGGVQVGEWYAKTGGTVAWRVA